MIVDHYIKKWDSDFFSYKIGEAIIRDYNNSEFINLKQLFLNNNYKLIYLHPSSNKVFIELSKSQIPLVDTKIIYSKSSKNFKTHVNSKNIEPYWHDENYTVIKKLTFRSGEFSRFRIDKAFQNNEFERLYIKWIDNSLNRIIADDVLVYYLNNEVVGFISYSISNKKLKIGLIAVDINHSGHGVGKELLFYVENIAKNDNLNEVEVATQQANIAAQNFYEACNYKVKSKNPIFHLWCK